MSKKSEEINNAILANARKDIRNAKIAIGVGIIFILIIITLVSLEIFNLGALVFTPVLAYITHIQIDAVRMKEAIFILQRYIFEDGFKEKYDKEHNLNQNKDEHRTNENK